MINNQKICVAGVGAVGGLLAAMLGKVYGNSLTLIARGNRKRTLKEKGIVLHSQVYGEIVSFPVDVTETLEHKETQDYIFICVKNYSLDQMAGLIRPAVGKDTVLVPVMNGVEAGDRLRELFPEAIVCDAVIYTNSSANPDYSITQNGIYSYMLVGDKKCGKGTEAAERVERLLRNTGFDCRFTEGIESEVWQKFIHNCAYNTLTARHLATNADIRENPELQNDLLSLLNEGYQVGLAEGVELPEDLVQEKYHFVMDVQPANGTSSTRRDVEAQRPSEIDTFSGAILRKAAVHGLNVTVTERYHRELLGMIG